MNPSRTLRQALALVVLAALLVATAPPALATEDAAQQPDAGRVLGIILLATLLVIGMGSAAHSTETVERGDAECRGEVAVTPAADRDTVFFQHPEPRCGFTGIADTYWIVPNLLHETGREGGNARNSLEQIQSGPLGFEQIDDRPLHRKNQVTGLHLSTIVQRIDYLDGGILGGENTAADDFGAGCDKRLPGNDIGPA